MFTQIERELRQSIAEYENTDKMVDAVAFVANVFADIGQLAYKGIKRLAMSGYLLEEANREIGRDALKFAVKPPTELVSDHWSRLILPTTTWRLRSPRASCSTSEGQRINSQLLSSGAERPSAEGTWRG